MNKFAYILQGTWAGMKAGQLVTPHGTISTPVFMPVGTKASVKSLDNLDLENLGAEVILGNTYHLYLRPGDELIRDLYGLHSFMQWNRPILTDSGGYQVSSLGTFKQAGEERLSKISEDGVRFYSHLDGSKHLITPEKSIQIQTNLGADIIMAFDEATPATDKHYAAAAMERTHRWLERSKSEWQRQQLKRSNYQAFFGIIQGGDYEDLRRQSAEFVLGQDLDGVAIGGASIGQSASVTEANVGWIRDLLPQDKPLYLMGVGVGPYDAVEAVKSGADMFDCVAPTKIARSGLLYHGKLHLHRDPNQITYTSEYPKQRININRQEFSKDTRVIDDSCDCYTCTSGYSRAYLRHLSKARELAYYRLASIHNVRTMVRTVQQLREHILQQGSAA